MEPSPDIVMNIDKPICKKSAKITYIYMCMYLKRLCDVICPACLSGNHAGSTRLAKLATSRVEIKSNYGRVVIARLTRAGFSIDDNVWGSQGEMF
jgi:hypothetical protein